MRFIQWIGEVIKNPRQYMLTIVLGAIVIVLGVWSYQSGNAKKGISYLECLDENAVTVNAQAVTFKEAAVYVAYEEQTVEEQARVYDSEHTNKYWNLHIDGEFVRLSAKRSTQKMLIHDIIFYQMALDEKMELSEEEKVALENNVYDFWSDLTEDGKEQRLGVTEEDIHESMERMALAQKCQEIYSIINNCDKSDYDFTGEAYQELLAENEYTINDTVWDKLTFGSITLKHNFY